MKTIKLIKFPKPTEYNAKIKKLSDGTIRYCYKVRGGSRRGFSSSIFWQIGEPVKPEFEELLSLHGLKVSKDYIQLDTAPWISDRLEPI